MAEYATVFQRYEKKYLLVGEQYQSFREAIDEYTQADQYGESTICNIYYDTENYDLIRRSIEKPVYKEKLRLRSYGVPERDGRVFLEIKKKYKGIVYKRRLPLRLNVAYESLKNLEIVGDDNQIAREINYFLKMYKPAPSVFLAYDRIAVIGRDDEELRMTFDSHMRSRLKQIDLLAGDEGELLLPEDHVILEIKVAGAYPFWLIRILEDLQIYPVSFSKYGNVYSRQIIPRR